MAPSVFSVLALAAALRAIPAHGQGEQQPLNEATGGINHHAYLEARPAEITIFNDPKWPCVPETGQPSVDLDVPLNTCVSANFTLDSNVHLMTPGLCPGGTKSPYISIYPSSSCTGASSHPTWYDRRVALNGPGYCLGKAVWGSKITPPEGPWSMEFRCDGAESDEPMRFLHVTLPEPPSKAEPEPARPRPKTASVSDSACYISGMGMAGAPKFIFQRPEADVCVNVAPKHRLKIYRNALCPNGTEALFARFGGRDCRGSPVELKEVDSNMMATNSPSTCIDMGGEEASSYTFWCTGDLHQKDVPQGLFPDDDDDDDEMRVRLHYTYGAPARSSSTKSGTGSLRMSMDCRLIGLTVLAAVFTIVVR
ncbi:hypothetical protein Neosp_013116 [[Neocosmospora] mangrovei]